MVNKVYEPILDAFNLTSEEGMETKLDLWKFNVDLIYSQNRAPFGIDLD